MSLKWKFYLLACIITIICSVLLIAKSIYFDIGENTLSKPVSIFIYCYLLLLILKSLAGIRFVNNVHSELHPPPKKIIRILFHILAVFQLLLVVMLITVLVDSIVENGFLYKDIQNVLFYFSISAFCISSFYALVFDIPLMLKLKRNINQHIETIGKENNTQ